MTTTSAVSILIVCLSTLAQSEIQCEYPKAPEHGSVSIMGSLAFYSCDKNFRLMGSMSSFCIGTGKWNNPKPACVEIKCEYPEAPEHGSVVLFGDKPVFNSLATYTCNKGFRLLGSRASICSDNGKWNVPTPRCVDSEISSSSGAPLQITPLPFLKYFTSTPTRSPTSTSTRSPTSTTTRSLTSTSVVGYSSSTPTVSTGIQPPSAEHFQSSSVAVGDNSNCTCTYINSDANLVAYANTKRLRTRDLVKDGYKITFHCSPLGYYRLIGPSNITCRYCRTWFSSEYPKCELPRTGGAIIRFQGTGSITELPGGYLGVPLGSPLRLICLRYSESNRPQLNKNYSPYNPENSPQDLPEWEVLIGGSKVTPNDIVIYNQVTYEHGRITPTKVLELNNVKRKHNNVYHCVVRHLGNMSIEIQAVNRDASCPEFNQDGDFTVHYDKGQSVNSTAVFSCKNSNEKILGYPNLTCMSNGRWSADPPRCMKICPKLEETEGMRIYYSNLQETDSTANFQCQPPRMRKGVSYTRCLRDGQWADPVPTCELSLCHLSDLYSELPGNIVIITGEALSATVPYNFSLHLNCANNGRMKEMSDTVRCGLDGMWEVADKDSSRHRRPDTFTGPARLSSFGGQLQSSSLRNWFESCFDPRGSYPPLYTRRVRNPYRPTKQPKI